MRKILLGICSSLAMVSCLNADIFDGNELSAKVGTLGAGLEYSTDINSLFGVRTGFNAYSINKNFTKSDINYDASVDLRSYSLIFDYFPFENGFKLSAGALYNGNKANVTANATNGLTYDLNNVNYTSTEIGSLKGNIDFNKIAPYLGLGYDSAKTKKAGFSFSAEVGAMFQDSPKATLTAEYGATVTNAQKQLINENLKAEEAQLNADLSSFKVYPVVAIGIGYKF